MRLHTLGPQQTDSFAAAEEYLAKKKLAGQIVLHSSFEAIYQQLQEMAGDYLIIPAAFESKMHESWGQLHYRYLERLNLVDSIITRLDPLVLCAKDNPEKIVAYTHPATEELLRNNLPEKAAIKLSPSKYQAYQEFMQDGAYVLTSQKLIEAGHDVRIIKTFNTSMLWSIYQIGG